jgi:hypothetical protein
MPAARTVNEWLATASGHAEREKFLADYMAAREVQQHLYVDRALAVAEGRESPDLDPVDFDNPREYRAKVGESVQRDRLIVDTLQWTAERLLPKVYRRGMRVEHAGSHREVRVFLGSPADEQARDGPVLPDRPLSLPATASEPAHEKVAPDEP